jgi:hypothetical protein
MDLCTFAPVSEENITETMWSDKAETASGKRRTF